MCHCPVIIGRPLEGRLDGSRIPGGGGAEQGLCMRDTRTQQASSDGRPVPGFWCLLCLLLAGDDGDGDDGLVLLLGARKRGRRPRQRLGKIKAKLATLDVHTPNANMHVVCNTLKTQDPLACVGPKKSVTTVGWLTMYINYPYSSSILASMCGEIAGNSHHVHPEKYK